MEDCIFCKIVAKDIPAQIVYEDEQFLAFKDINPVAPVHILIIPKKHLPDLLAAQEEDEAMLGKIQLLAAKLAREAGLEEKGFRVINNCREDGGQEVFHLHYHLLGGRKMQILG